MPRRTERAAHAVPPLRGTERILSRPRQLRRSSTDAERKLWKAVRAHQLGGFAFRRQQPIGNFIVDFFCPRAKLVIEIDGGQHGLEDVAAKDAERTRWLELSGYKVLRFWNNDVLANLEGVVETIRAALGATSPPPQPSPSRGEGV